MLAWWNTTRKKIGVVDSDAIGCVPDLTPGFSECLSVTGYGEVLTALLLMGNVTGACSINSSKRFTVN